MPYTYLLDKIRQAEFTDAPFTHIQINDFFSPEDFAAVTAAPEIATVDLRSDDELFDALIEGGYKIIDFPGCILDRRKYIAWHKDRKAVNTITNSACEGFGMTLRLIQAKSPAIAELNEFLGSTEFQQTLAEKFGIVLDDVFYDAGIQKYLDGYEISPHPDIRRKALTYMVNVNPHPQSETQDHHTHYLKFRPDFSYVQAYWDGHPELDRCWVPWTWCQTEKVQRENNSIVIFSPNNSTMHAVKTHYDHLKSQRTQLYGNLWYHQSPARTGPEWEDFVITPRAERVDLSLKGRIKSAVPRPVKEFIKGRRGVDGDVIADRLSRT
jgi:hypothetical protein